MEFGDRLKKLRKQNKYSQKDLGILLGLGQTTIANYEKNIRFPSPDILIQIADIFGESIDRLVGREADNVVGAFSKELIYEIKGDLMEFVMESEEDRAVSYLQMLAINEERLIQLYEQVFGPMLIETGQLWEDGKISIAKEHNISALVQRLIHISYGRLTPVIRKKPFKGTVICMSLASELHTIGIQMVSDFFSLQGYRSLNIGGNVPTDALIGLIEEMQPYGIAISATLAYHKDALTNLITILKMHRSSVQTYRIMVGGQAFLNKEDALSTGADDYVDTYETLQLLLHGEE